MFEDLLYLKPYKYFACWVIFAEPLAFFISFSIKYITLFWKNSNKMRRNVEEKKM
jgi:hypothetical protein